MTAKRPKPDMEITQSVREYLTDELNGVIFDLSNRASLLLDERELPRAAIALDMLQSRLSTDLAHSELREAYPLQAWREDTVEVPRAWLRVLVEGWETYKDAPDGTTFGEAMGLEGGGQGKFPVRTKFKQMRREVHLSNAAIIEYLTLKADGESASWERAYLAVAEAEGVSPDTVKRASEARRPAALARMDAIGLLVE